MVRSVFLARHGNRLDFIDAGWSSASPRPYDPPLSPDGVEQVRALARRLRTESIAHVFSSPFLRCIESADILAEALADADVKVEVGLSEWLSADWFPAPPETLSLAELCRCCSRIDPHYVSRGVARHGESGEGALLRSADTITCLISDFGGDLLLVGHGASILGATAGLLGVPVERANGLLPEIPLASLTRLSLKDQRWTLDLACDVAHLGSREQSVRYR